MIGQMKEPGATRPLLAPGLKSEPGPTDDVVS